MKLQKLITIIYGAYAIICAILAFAVRILILPFAVASECLDATADVLHKSARELAEEIGTPSDNNPACENEPAK